MTTAPQRVLLSCTGSKPEVTTSPAECAATPQHPEVITAAEVSIFSEMTPVSSTAECAATPQHQEVITAAEVSIFSVIKC